LIDKRPQKSKITSIVKDCQVDFNQHPYIKLKSESHYMKAKLEQELYQRERDLQKVGQDTSYALVAFFPLLIGFGMLMGGVSGTPILIAMACLTFVIVLAIKGSHNQERERIERDIKEIQSHIIQIELAERRREDEEELLLNDSLW